MVSHDPAIAHRAKRVLKVVDGAVVSDEEVHS
jgi:predicted ABC-type transport system involved in lysophospholipase L1 biosynthesis ATPase subunit